MQQKIVKVISALLAITILYANSASLISYAADNFLSAQELESQGISTNNSNVEFDVYYDGGKHTQSLDINSTETKLNVKLNVKNAGYLKNITVDFADSNFEITDDNTNTAKVQKFDAENKTIAFNQINSGNEVIKTLNISANKDDEVNADMFNKDNQIKLTATYVDGNGKEFTVSKTIVIHTGWKAENAVALLNYEITKYIPYATNGTNKIITQGKITSGLQDSVLPIKETSIEITAPKINNQYPETVTVIANNTIATNGDVKGEKFTSANWNYDAESGKITINVKNDATNGKISWSKNTLDEYIVTYIYSSEVYQAVKDTTVRVTYSANSQLSLYNAGTGTVNVTKSVSGYVDQTKKLGYVVDLKTKSTTTLNKGYMYNNKITADANKRETEYSVEYTANISYADIVDELTLTQGIDQFVTANGTENSTTVGGKNYTYDKTLKISKAEFDRIFGESGQITIQDNSKTTSPTIINKDTKTQNGYITIDLTSFNTNSIIIKTSKPQKEGNISFEITKVVSKNVDYTENQIKTFSSIKTQVSGNAKNGTIDIANQDLVSSIALEEPTQKASISLSTDTLSTIVKNEDVKISVTLENDTIDDIMHQYPTITIKLPENIESVTLKNVERYFDDELNIVDSNVVENNDGTKNIVIVLDGIQTKYNNAAVQGATIIATVDITLNKLTPTTNTQIEAIVEDGDTGNTISSKADIKYVAPTGLVTTNAMSGYNGGSEEIIAINGEPQEALIPTSAEQKQVKYTMNVINNYSNTLDNVKVLGRTPFAGNKDVLTLQDLGSTMDLPLSSGLTISKLDSSKYTVYYSENGEATTDLSNTSNKWVMSVSDYSKVKSYMIVLNEKMNTGDSFIFEYTATIPANLTYEKSAYENYAVYFNNNQTTGTIADKAVATKIGVTTGTVAKLDAVLTSEIPNGEKVKGGTSLKYTLTINNTGSKSAENVVVSIPIPTGVIYIPETGESEDSYSEEYDEEFNRTLKFNIGKIAGNSKIVKNITLQTYTTGQEEITVSTQATVTANDNISITSNTITNTVEKTYFKTQVSTKSSSMNYIMVGDTYYYTVTLKSSESYSITDGQSIYRTNTIVKVTLPEELKYESIELTQYDKEILGDKDITSLATVTTKGNVVTINIGDLDGGRGKTLTVKSKISNLPEGVYQKEITTKATVQADDTNVENIPDATSIVNKAGIKTTQISNIPEGTTITAGEEFTYTFTIENLSQIVLNDIQFTDILPNDVQFTSLQVSYSDGTVKTESKLNENGQPIAILNLNGEDKVTVNVNVTAKSIDSDSKITNKASLTNELLETVQTNTITHTIKKFVNTEMDIDEETGENIQTKKIIGTVWIDSNKDGIKDVDEVKVSGVTVLLLDNSTGNLAVASTGETAIITTAEDGSYMFNDINKGEYTVIFLYDSANYSPTTYQKQGVDERQNSDAIDKTVIYEDKTQIGAVTETIILAEENKYDIDLGLIENPKFDLKLDKIVAKITVNNSKDTTTHEYNKNFAKIDFESKYADSSTMVVEYKFIITNEGAIPGYVKKLADYLPTELKFSTELNKDWYEGKDGTIYNASLANTIINPGESKEVTLILTKNMTKESFGTITNTAEIYETSSDYGLEDVDSIPGNKSTNEDDISIANVVTGVKTGQLVIYSTLIVTVIAIIGIGIYVIRKKVSM